MKEGNLQIKMVSVHGSAQDRKVNQSPGGGRGQKERREWLAQKQNMPEEGPAHGRRGPVLCSLRVLCLASDILVLY